MRMRATPPGFGERQSGGLSRTTPAQRAGGPGAQRRDEPFALRRTASNPTPARTSDGAVKFPSSWRMRATPLGFGERQSGGLSRTTPAHRAGGPGAQRRDESVAVRRTASNPTLDRLTHAKRLRENPSPAAWISLGNPRWCDAVPKRQEVSASCKRRSLPSAPLERSA
jgi:hypothetical protein